MMFNNNNNSELADNTNLIDFYKPSSDATKDHYEHLLSLITRLGGAGLNSNANGDDSLKILADDVIDICKDVDIAFADRQRELENLLGVKVSNDAVRNISLTCDKLSDYVQSSTRQQQKNNDKTNEDAADADDNENAKLFDFSIGNVLERSAFERRGGMNATFNDNNSSSIIDDAAAENQNTLEYGNPNSDDLVDSLLLNDDDNNNENQQQKVDGISRNNNKKALNMKSTFLTDIRFHPQSLEKTFITDMFTSLFPDLPHPERLMLESELTDLIGNHQVDDMSLRTQLPLRINPDSNPKVASFLNKCIENRWHLHYGLKLAEERSRQQEQQQENQEQENNNNNNTVSVLEELRQLANMEVASGNKVGYLLRRKLRGVLKLISKSEIDQFDEEDEIDDQQQQNDNNNNGGDDLLFANNNNNNEANSRIKRRGQDLNLVDFSIHHPMSQGNRLVAAQQQQQKQNPSSAAGGSHSGFFGRQQDPSLILPEGSEVKSRPEFSEVIVPMPPQVRVEAKDRVKLSVAFPDWARSAFPPGFESLNPMQSKVYPSVFRSDRNVLVCAPTGAGKTGVAIMACLRAVERYGQFETDGDDDENDGNQQQQLRYIGPGRGWKIVYIAPMVALAREVTQKLSEALSKLPGEPVNVAELSGDSALSQQEMKDIHVLVATPEKWDIVSRKTLDLGAAAEVKLIIFDEIHMLHSERGAVVESIAARTLHQVERTCEPVRFVGLSATLPNYEDVAQFLRVNVSRGDLYFFHGGYRPCPLQQTFACPERNNKNNKDASGRFLSKQTTSTLEDICYTKIQEMLNPDGTGNQPIMVFVHSRKDTFDTAEKILELAIKNGFQTELSRNVGDLNDSPAAKSEKLRSLLQAGLGVHHAGLSLDDKRLVEDLFGARRLAVLVCTATLAWGVNLPAHTVIIKGTKIYSAANGGFTDLSILDTLQMFGRAGRPGLDTHGEAVILTSDRENLKKYLKFLTVQDPVESHLLLKIMEAINAEVALGSVSNLAQCVKWFKFTWFYTRMRAAPRLYGILQAHLSKDPSLTLLSEDICHTTLKKLDEFGLVNYNDLELTCHPTDLGRITSFFNLSFATTYNIVTKLRENMLEHELFEIFSTCQEFSAIRVRDGELEELRRWRKVCPMPIEHPDEKDGSVKVNILAQLAISNGRLQGRNLGSDLELIKDASCTRITKAIHEIALVKGWAHTSSLALKLHLQLKNRQWHAQCPLRQFGLHAVPEEIIRRLEAARVDWVQLKHHTPGGADDLIEHVSDRSYAEQAFELIHKIPQLRFVHIVHVAQSRAFLKLEVAMQPDFAFDPDLHPESQPFSFLMTIEDGDGSNILFQERISVSRQAVQGGELITVPCFVRLRDPKPSCYVARCVALEWLGSTTTRPIDLRRLMQPDPSQAPTAPALAPEDENDYPIINNEQDHNALFSYIPVETGWNPAQLTSFNSLFRRRTNTIVSSQLGCGREALHSMVVAQFLDNFDNMQEAKKDGSLSATVVSSVLGNDSSNNNSISSIFQGRLLFVSPQLDCAQRRFNFYKTAMKNIDDARKEAGQDPRNTRVRFLSGHSSIDSSKLVFGDEDSSSSSSPSPLLVFSTPARLIRLSASFPEIFDAFDVVIFDHLHTISHMPYPRSGASGESGQSVNDAADEDEAYVEEESSENLCASGKDDTVNYFASPNSSLWNNDSEGGSLRYAELIQCFVETQTQKVKQISKKIASSSSSSSSNSSPSTSAAASLLSSLFLNRIVGFSSLTTSADNVLAKFLKVPTSSSYQESEGPAVLQLAPGKNNNYRQRTVALEVQEIPKHEDREAAAINHVFRLLTEERYVASSVIVFTPDQKQAESMAETFMLQYRDSETVLHEHLSMNNNNAEEKNNRKNDFILTKDGENNNNNNENKDENENNKTPLDEPLLQEYCPCGVAILSPQTTTRDLETVFKTAKEHEKMVCFVPMSLVGRVPSGTFQYSFICFSQTMQIVSTSKFSAQSPLVDVDVPTMLLMASRSATESKVWCTTSKQQYWNRILNDPLPCLPLLSVSIAPSFRPFLKSYTEELEDKLSTDLMPHFVAESLLEYCLTEARQLAAVSPNGSVTAQALFLRIQKHIVVAAAKFSPFAYSLPGPTQEDLLEFFAVVVDKVFDRLHGLRVVKKKVLAIENGNTENEDAAEESVGTTVIIPTIFGKLIAKYQLSAIDCGRIVNFCNSNQQQQQDFVPTEASVLLLACRLSCICASTTIITTPQERPLLRELARFFGSHQKVFNSDELYGNENEASFVSSSAGKAFLLVLLFCSGKLASTDSSITNLPQILRTFMEEESNFVISRGNKISKNFFDRLPLSDWCRQLSQVLETLINSALPAILEFCAKKNSSWLNVAVSVLRKVTTGVQLENSLSTSSSSSSLRQLPGFEDIQRLELCKKYQVTAAEDIGAVDDDVREKLFEGLSESCVESIAEFVNACPVLETAANVKYDEQSGTVAVRCVIESAVEEDQTSLPLTACTPRFAQLLRFGGKTILKENVDEEVDVAVAADQNNYSLPTVAVPSRFLVTLRLDDGKNNNDTIIRYSRIITLEKVKEVVIMKFQVPPNVVFVPGQSKIVVDVRSLAYQVDSRCVC